MNVLPKELQVQIIHLLLEGSGIRSVARITGTHKCTVLRLMCHVGNACGILMQERLQSLVCRSIEVDELWAFVGLKQGRLIQRGQFGESKKGDQAVFIALDRDTRMVLCFHVGKRDGPNTMKFMRKLSRCVRPPCQITTDAYPGYIWAIGNTFGRNAHYAQLSKIFKARMGPRRSWCVGIDKTIAWGAPDPELISTSHIERLNLTVRQEVRRLMRKTSGFSKKHANLVCALNMFFCYYNFGRIHESIKTTPAIAAGLEHRIWTIDDFVNLA